MIVIDASVANKLILSHEENHLQAKSIFENHLVGINTIIIPELLFYEVANTLATKSKLSYWKVTNSLTKLYQINLQIYYPNERDLKTAARLAKQYGSTVYDMVYAVTARKYKTTFITADTRFANATKFKFVKLLQDQT